MRIFIYFFVVLSMILVGSLAAHSIVSVPIYEDQQYEAILTGKEAIPPQDTGAYGKAFFKINHEMTQITYRVELYNIYDVLMVTLRLNFPGKEGPIAVWLYPEEPPPTPIKLKGRFDGVLAEGVITEQDLVGRLYGHPVSKLVQEIKNGGVFVQVDTLRHQIGELRGQLEPFS